MLSRVLVRKIKLVELLWQDIQTIPGWHERKEEKALVTLKAYGLLVKKGRKVVTLASCYDPETDYWADPMDYPKGCILSMRVIEEIKV